MAKQALFLGTVANDGTGTQARAGGDIINDNFDELYAGVQAYSALVYGATVNIDFASLFGLLSISLTGDLELTTSNLVAGRSKTIRIVSDASIRTFTFPAGWVFVGAAAPASIAASKTAILTLSAFSTTDASIVAAYAVEP